MQRNKCDCSYKQEEPCQACQSEDIREAEQAAYQMAVDWMRERSASMRGAA